MLALWTYQLLQTAISQKIVSRRVFSMIMRKLNVVAFV